MIPLNLEETISGLRGVRFELHFPTRPKHGNTSPFEFAPVQYHPLARLHVSDLQPLFRRFDLDHPENFIPVRPGKLNHEQIRPARLGLNGAGQRGGHLDERKPFSIVVRHRDLAVKLSLFIPQLQLSLPNVQGNRHLNNPSIHPFDAQERERLPRLGGMPHIGSQLNPGVILTSGAGRGLVLIRAIRSILIAHLGHRIDLVFPLEARAVARVCLRSHLFILIRHPSALSRRTLKSFLETYGKLTSAINRAKVTGDIDTLREIANDPHGFILRQGWRSLDFSEEVELAQLGRLYETLQLEIITVLESLTLLRESPDYELCQRVEATPAMLDNLAKERLKMLERESAELEQQAARLGGEIAELTADTPNAIR